MITLHNCANGFFQQKFFLVQKNIGCRVGVTDDVESKWGHVPEAGKQSGWSNFHSEVFFWNIPDYSGFPELIPDFVLGIDFDNFVAFSRASGIQLLVCPASSSNITFNIQPMSHVFRIHVPKPVTFPPNKSVKTGPCLKRPNQKCKCDSKTQKSVINVSQAQTRKTPETLS